MWCARVLALSLGGLGMDLHSCRRRSAAKALTTLVIAWTLLVPAGARPDPASTSTDRLP